MNHRDNELDEILEPLRSSRPDQAMLQRLQDHVTDDLHRYANRGRRHTLIQLLAAMIVGFVIGAAYMRTLQRSNPAQPLAVVSDDEINATVVTVYANH